MFFSLVSIYRANTNHTDFNIRIGISGSIIAFNAFGRKILVVNEHARAWVFKEQELGFPGL